MPKKMCIECKERPARCGATGKKSRKGVILRQHHELCEQCYRALRNSLRRGRPYGRGKRKILFPDKINEKGAENA